VNGQPVFTHGVNVGASQTNSRNLQQATEEFINNLAQGNQNLRMNGGYQRTTLSGRTALMRYPGASSFPACPMRKITVAALR